MTIFPNTRKTNLLLLLQSTNSKGRVSNFGLLSNINIRISIYGVVGIGTYAPYYRAWWGRAAQVTIEGMLNL
jgi:hypothetical protein